MQTIQNYLIQLALKRVGPLITTSVASLISWLFLKVGAFGIVVPADQQTAAAVALSGILITATHCLANAYTQRRNQAVQALVNSGSQNGHMTDSTVSDVAVAASNALVLKDKGVKAIIASNPTLQAAIALAQSKVQDIIQHRQETIHSAVNVTATVSSPVAGFVAQS